MFRLRNGGKMFLNILGTNEMYMSVAEILGTNIEVIKKFVIENAEGIVDCHYDKYGIEQMDLGNLINGNGFQRIDTLIVNHITPRECEENIWKEGVLTLSHALTRKTALSDYLQELGLTFSFDEKQIIMCKNGRIVEVENKLGTNLKMRLGGEHTSNDYNINGYLFIDDFEEATVRGWLGSPEFLKSLATYYNKNSIADNYADKCDNNYFVSFEVPLDKVDLDGFSDKIDADRKTGILLRYTINALAYAEMRRKTFLSMTNPILYLKRDYDVPKEDIRKIWKLQCKQGKWIPVEIDEVINQ